MEQFFLDYFANTPEGTKVLIVIGGIVVVGGVVKVAVEKGIKCYNFVKDYFLHMEKKRIEDEEFKKSVLEMKEELKSVSSQVQQLERLTTAVESLSTDNKNFKDRLSNLEKSVTELHTESRNADKEIIETIKEQQHVMDDHQREMAKVTNVLGMLVESDEADYRAFLLQTLEKCKEHGNKIDTLTLSNVITGFNRYRAEGGNSWAEEVVKELRTMEIVPFPNINYNIDVQSMLLGIPEYSSESEEKN
ncbi:MAG TPA: hypothetical protein DCW90_13985 [Lachnospiraceae bacterium]|nr:hypothetical protein [Lachnospiraceae bacterium]